ncbi:hypothetical protein [Kitasatospora sp. NPDC101183]|uniref:hypothetical protein n=1 Tax=Kitasatospora sp. NPDC101183 TaxID=3364100 RepID=UPI003801D8A8
MDVFPPRPVRGVRARYVHQAGCPSDYAIVTVDFEPWEAGLHLETAADATLQGDAPPDYLALLHAALLDGVAAELAQALPGVPVALALVVRHSGVHDVDTGERSYRHAGRLAAREALAVLNTEQSWRS